MNRTVSSGSLAPVHSLPTYAAVSCISVLQNAVICACRDGQVFSVPLTVRASHDISASLIDGARGIVFLSCLSVLIMYVHTNLNSAKNRENKSEALAQDDRMVKADLER